MLRLTGTGIILIATSVATLTAVAQNSARPRSARPAASAAKGAADRPWLGISWWLANEREVVVCGVLADGPAGKAGIITDDSLLAIAGQPILSLEDSQQALSNLRLDEKVDVLVERAGERKTIPVTLAAMPKDGGQELLLAAAEAGEAWAMTELGMRYAHLQGEFSYVKENPKTAVDWFERAIVAGDNAAPLHLGVLCLRGEGVSQDNELAQKLFVKARLMKGTGVKKGVASAASNHLAAMCLHGKAANADAKMAFRFFRDAANQGSLLAMYEMAAMLEAGNGAKPDLLAAIDWYRQASIAGYAPAQKAMVRLDLAGKIPTEPPENGATAASKNARVPASPGSRASVEPIEQPSSRGSNQASEQPSRPAQPTRLAARANNTRPNVPIEPKTIGGALDETFGSGGHAVCDFLRGGGHGCYAVAVQPDDKIVIAGEAEKGSGTGNFLLAVARFNADGTLDGSFGSSGRRLFNFGPYDDGCRGRNLLLQPNGKIIVGGRAEVTGYGYEFGIVRFNSDGSVDSSFNDNGSVTTPVTTVRSAETAVMALQHDGKILAAGMVNARTMVAGGNALGLVRYQSNGKLDTTFSGDGKVITNLPGDKEEVTDITVRSDGKIVLVGRTEGPGRMDMLVLRFNADGTPDTGFDRDGTLQLKFQGSDNALSVVLAQGDKTIVGGSTDDKPLLMRLNNDGSIDRSFGTNKNGMTSLSFGCRSISRTADGHIVVAGAPKPLAFAVMVLSPDGILQTHFGKQGVASHKLSERDVPRAIAVAPDGRIVVAGEISNDRGSANCAVLRLSAN